MTPLRVPRLTNLGVVLLIVGIVLTVSGLFLPFPVGIIGVILMLVSVALMQEDIVTQLCWIGVLAAIAGLFLLMTDVNNVIVDSVFVAGLVLIMAAGVIDIWQSRKQGPIYQDTKRGNRRD